MHVAFNSHSASHGQKGYILWACSYDGVLLMLYFPARSCRNLHDSRPEEWFQVFPKRGYPHIQLTYSFLF